MQLLFSLRWANAGYTSRELFRERTVYVHYLRKKTNSISLPPPISMTSDMHHHSTRQHFTLSMEQTMWYSSLEMCDSLRWLPIILKQHLKRDYEDMLMLFMRFHANTQPWQMRWPFAIWQQVQKESTSLLKSVSPKSCIVTKKTTLYFSQFFRQRPLYLSTLSVQKRCFANMNETLSIKLALYN